MADSKSKKVNSEGRPLTSLLTDTMTKDELSLWAISVFYNFNKANGLDNLVLDIEYILRKKSKMKYRPLWYPDNKLVSGYICEEPIDLLPDDDGGILLKDILMLQSTINVLKDMQRRKEQVLLIIPIHAATLYDRRMKDMFKFYCKYSLGKTGRNIVFMLTGMDEQILKTQDIEHIRGFGSFCRAIIVDTPVRTSNPGKYVSLRPHAFGFSAKKFINNEAAFVDFLSEYTDACDKIGVKSFLTNIDTHSVMSMAISSGVSYLEGRAILPPEKYPKHAAMLATEKIYENFLLGSLNRN